MLYKSTGGASRTLPFFAKSDHKFVADKALKSWGRAFISLGMKFIAFCIEL